jgi:hypothetical protein
VPSKKAVVAPSSAIFEVIRHVVIRPLKPMVTRPKIWTIVRMTFMEAFKVKAVSKKIKAQDEKIIKMSVLDPLPCTFTEIM